MPGSILLLAPTATGGQPPTPAGYTFFGTLQQNVQVTEPNAGNGRPVQRSVTQTLYMFLRQS